MVLFSLLLYYYYLQISAPLCPVCFFFFQICLLYLLLFASFLDLLKLKLCLLFKILDICMNVFGRVLPGPRLREPDSLSTWRLMTWRVLSTRRWALELLLWARSPRARARAVDYRALARWRTLTASFGLSAQLPRRPLSWKLDDPRILSFLCQATVHLLWDPHIEKKSLAVRI